MLIFTHSCTHSHKIQLVKNIDFQGILSWCLIKHWKHLTSLTLYKYKLEEVRKKKGTSKVSNNGVKEKGLRTVFLPRPQQNVSLLILIPIEVQIAVDPDFKTHSEQKGQEKA